MSVTTKSYPILFAVEWHKIGLLLAAKIPLTDKTFLSYPSELFKNSIEKTDKKWEKSFVLHLRNLFKYMCENQPPLKYEYRCKDAIHINKINENERNEMLIFDLSEGHAAKRTYYLKLFYTYCNDLHYKLSGDLTANIRLILKTMDIAKIREEKQLNENTMRLKGKGNRVFVPYHYLCNTSKTFKELYEKYPIEFMSLFGDYLEDKGISQTYKLSRNLLFAEQSEMFYLSNDKFGLDLLNHLEVREFQDIRCKALSKFLDYCEQSQSSILKLYKIFKE